MNDVKNFLDNKEYKGDFQNLITRKKKIIFI